MNFKIALLPGDGIGPEVTSAAVDVLKAAGEKFNINFDISEYLVGGSSYEKYGNPLTDDVLQACYDSDAVLLGAVGGTQWDSLPSKLKPEAALLKLRKSLGLFINIRPAKVYNALLDASSLKADVLAGTDILILRELTGDVYFGEPRGVDDEKGFNTMIYTKEEVERIARYGFEVASKRKRILHSVDKANVLETSQFWRKIVVNISKDFPDVKLEHMYVDNAAMQLVRNPKQFDVILTQNMFGDILSDIGGMITGSLGMLPSASLGSKYALYEPVHGSAPDIAGQNKANPVATIASLALMFVHSLQMAKPAEMIEEAISKTLDSGYRTNDISQPGDAVVTTTKMKDLIVENFNTIFEEQATSISTH